MCSYIVVIWDTNNYHPIAIVTAKHSTYMHANLLHRHALEESLISNPHILIIRIFLKMRFMFSEVHFGCDGSQTFRFGCTILQGQQDC